MNENVFMEVSDILDSFDIDEINKLIQEQINPDYSEDVYTDMQTDYLKPLYYNYAKLAKYNLDEDTRTEAENKYTSICMAFLNAILDKFHMTIDTNWLSDHYTDIPAITLAYYSFFVLDFTTNIYEILVNYIDKNTDEILKTFDGLKVKKDASTMTNKQTLSAEMALIVSNIYDITEWIFDQLEEQDFFDYMDNSYVPIKLISAMYSEGYLGGTFANAIFQLIHTNIALRSKICFQYIYQVKNGEIADKYTKSDKKDTE